MALQSVNQPYLKSVLLERLDMLDMALQSALPEVSPAGEAGHAGYDLTISQSALPEISPAGEAGHAGDGALSVQHEGLLYMPVAQQCRPVKQYLLLQGNCTISQKSKRSRGKKTF
jgi:hypothetical protein